MLITITLVAFLVLILVSLATLTRVETQVATNSQHQAQARQNALLALNIAIGQLQRHAGPDQRITGAADLLIPSGITIDASTSGTAARAALDTYWTASRNRHWTGVWRNTNTDDYTATAPALGNPIPSPTPIWLISGNENHDTAPLYRPTDPISGLSVTSTPLDEIKDSADRSHRLLVKASAGITDAAMLDRAVTAPQVRIESDTVPGTGGTPVTVGHYAWWVGDEGVKARANLIDEHAAATADPGLIHRRATAQRPAIEAISTDGTDGLAPFYTANDPDLTTVLGLRQLDFIDSDPTFHQRLREHFHDLSATSRGVLADVKNGGLKRDLTHILGQSDLADFRTVLNAAYDTGTPAPLTTHNPTLSPVATPYATLPPDASATYSYTGPNGIFTHAATWEQLWSFNHLGNLATATPAGVFNASGEAVPRRHTATQHGVYPLIIQAKLFYRLRIVGGAPDPVDGVNRTGDIWVDVIPLAVIANPYSTPLAAADYTLRFTGVQPLVRFGISATNPGDVPSATEFPRLDGGTNANAENQKNLSNGYTGQIELILRSTGMKPGEAQVFTINPSSAENPTISNDLIEITSRTDDKQVVLHNFYDPVPALTYNFSANTSSPSKHIPADKTHVALYTTGVQMNAELHLDYDVAEGHRHAVHFVRGLDIDDPNCFLVDPIKDDSATQQGGGYLLVLNDAATAANSVSPLRPPQQAPFYQVNYRGIVLTFNGGSGSHPLEWARTFVKQGNTGGPGNAPNDFIAANLLFPADNRPVVRWGLVNIGEGFDQTRPPASIGGSGADDFIGFENLLYDLPAPGTTPAGIGHLQHFNTTGHVSAINVTPALERHSHVVHSWQVNHPVANSYPHPRVPRDQVIHFTPGMGFNYDGSYLWNDIFWDRFYFSTYPVNGAFDFATGTLPNARLRPFRPADEVPWDEPAHYRGDGNPATAANSRRAAENLLLDGAFNINSTSVAAWKAVLSGLRDIPLGTETAPANLTAPFARTLHQTGGADDARAGDTANAWAGIHNLTPAEIETLAEEIVLQVRRRGPFLSLAEFVNRRLVSATSATDDPAFGLAGTLQAALDRVVNQPGDIAAPFRMTSDTDLARSQIADADYIMSTALAGFPGYMLQGDLLSALGPSLTVRSDTFVIRTYGDTVNPATGDVTGRAWCEAIVQRTPDYVVPANGAAGNAPHEAATDPVNAEFGRRFVVTAFRWLNPEDI